MAQLKQLHNAKGVVQTTDGTTWTTISSYTLSTNATVSIKTWLLGKDSTGKVAVSEGIQSLERIAGTPTLIGSVVELLTFALGSNATLTTCAQRLNLSGDIIQLQVKGVAATTIDWQGKMDLFIN